MRRSTSQDDYTKCKCKYCDQPADYQLSLSTEKKYGWVMCMCANCLDSYMKKFSIKKFHGCDFNFKFWIESKKLGNCQKSKCCLAVSKLAKGGE